MKPWTMGELCRAFHSMGMGVWGHLTFVSETHPFSSVFAFARFKFVEGLSKFHSVGQKNKSETVIGNTNSKRWIYWLHRTSVTQVDCYARGCPP
jgi:hypothetical protein